MTFDPDYKDRWPTLEGRLANPLRTNQEAKEQLQKSLITQTRVVNLRQDTYDVYVGRPGKNQEGYWGNRHTIGYCPMCSKNHTRHECIVEFKKDFYRRLLCDIEFLKKTVTLRGKVLGCFCVPAECHGQIIADWLNGLP